jgi:hypothetical protein
MMAHEVWAIVLPYPRCYTEWLYPIVSFRTKLL